MRLYVLLKYPYPFLLSSLLGNLANDFTNKIENVPLIKLRPKNMCVKIAQRWILPWFANLLTISLILGLQM